MRKKLLSKNEFYIALVIIVLSIIIGLVNNVFFTLGNVFDLLRNGIVIGIFAVGALLVIISGGIDVSNTAIASFSMYTTAMLLKYINYDGSILLAFVISCSIGIVLGLINAALISFFKLPTLIVTLGTFSMFNGFLLTFIGSREIGDIPACMDDFSKLNIFSVQMPNGFTYSLHVSVLILIVLALVVAFILKYTMIGRGIYALGGDRASAERAGFNIVGIQFFIYAFIGFISGIAGIVQTGLMRNCNPVSLQGMELIVIASVVLGGAKITGGRGSVGGTILGVLLVVIINSSLLLLGIPSYWQRFATGFLILIGTGITSLQSHRENRKVIVNSLD